MGRSPVVTLLTDFGVTDAYVAAMKGVILTGCPDARLVDISHEIPPQDVTVASLVLRDAAPYFPAGTVHLAVIDPGVGTDRRAMIAAAGAHRFVGPDNGLFSEVIRALATEEQPAKYWDVSHSRVARPKRSHTFHGRDLFAPVAGALAQGAAPEDLGPPMDDPIHSSAAAIVRTAEGLRGKVVAVDHFGNLTTNIGAGALAGCHRLEVTFPGRNTPPARGLYRTYQEGPTGEPMGLIGSSGYLEIAICQASASERMHIYRGDAVEVRLWERTP